MDFEARRLMDLSKTTVVRTVCPHGHTFVHHDYKTGEDRMCTVGGTEMLLHLLPRAAVFADVDEDVTEWKFWLER